MAASYNKYQSYRQYFINPNYIGFGEHAPVSTAPDDIFNPSTVITSALLEQRNILRYQNQRVLPAEYYMHSKSATPVGNLLNKLMNDAAYQGYFAQSFRENPKNVGVISITNFDASINLSDYQLLVFDRPGLNDTSETAHIQSGFRINDFKSSVWYVINGTLYIILLNCTKYCSNGNSETTFADYVDVVWLRKVNNRDEVKLGLLAFSSSGEESTYITDNQAPMENLPSNLWLDYTDIASSVTNFTKYDANFYGVALNLSDYTVDIGDVIYMDRAAVTVTNENAATINRAIEQSKMKNWMFINPDLYTVTVVDETSAINIAFNNVSLVSDLGLVIYAEYTAEAEGESSMPRMEIPVVRLPQYSKFYLYNKNTFVKAEFTYRFNESKPLITISRDSTVSKSSIERSFVIDVDPETDKIMGQYPNYIPMNWKDPNYVSNDEDTDSHVYSRWIDTEDVFVFIDGVKLTPYVDYIVVNDSIVGEDIPAGSIKFLNRTNRDIAITFPVSEAVPEHNILAFTIPSSVNRNTYYGPVPDPETYVKDRSYIDLTDPSAYHDDQGTYPILDVGDLENIEKLPASMLTLGNYIVFAAGRYVPAYTQRKSIVLDNTICLNEVTTYNNIEYHSYFDDKGLEGLSHTVENYYPLIENVIRYVDGAMEEYVERFIKDEHKPVSNRITADSSAAYGVPTDYVNNYGANIFELWLRHNTRLVFKNDIDAATDEAKRRVPDKQTYFSANDDLTLRGYRNNIHVDGNGMQGMPSYTASNDINNEEIKEDNTEPQNP